MNQPSLGHLVRDLRRAAGLTQEELASRTGLSTRAISDLERGASHTPRSTTLQHLVAGLNLTDRDREHFDAVARAQEANASSAATSTRPRPLEPGRPSAPTGTTALMPLIGRSRERAVLEAHLAGEGPPLLLIAGEPGIGKTRLLQEASALAARLQLNVLRGSVLSPGDADSLDPIADALRHALRGRSPVLLRRDLQGCAALVHILPELTSSDFPGAESAPDGMNPAVTAGAVLRFIANTAGPAGTLLLLDNLHDAAAAGLALLTRVVRSSSDLPVRIVAAYRDGHCTGRDPLSARLASLAHDQLVRHLALSRLSTREAADLLTAGALQRGQTIDPWPARALHDSGGVPFYILAWAEHLELLRRKDADTVPWPIQQSVRYRMDSGPASARPVLEVLGATGGRATYAMLRDLVGLPSEDVQTALDWCLRERLVVEEDQEYAFAYGAIQTAVDADFSPTRRQIIRRRIAALMQNRGRGGLRTRSLDRVLPRTHAPEPYSTPASAREDERAFHIAVLRHAWTAANEGCREE